MSKAKMTFALVALAYALANPAVQAADDKTGAAPADPFQQLRSNRANVNVESGDEGFAKFMESTMGNMAHIGAILTNDMPERSAVTKTEKGESDGNIALGPTTGAPGIEAHMGMGAGDMKCAPGMMPACAPKLGGGKAGKHWCPLASLEGPNAVTDEQYQKLYDIKGQFISNVVPKGLSTYMMIRRMADLLTSADMDTKTIRDVERQIAGATSDLSTSVMDSMISAAQVLTPDQRRELHTKMVRASMGGGWKRPPSEAPKP